LNILTSIMSFLVVVPTAVGEQLGIVKNSDVISPNLTARHLILNPCLHADICFEYAVRYPQVRGVNFRFVLRREI
jgi:hypothetical protein